MIARNCYKRSKVIGNIALPAETRSIKKHAMFLIHFFEDRCFKAIQKLSV